MPLSGSGYADESRSRPFKNTSHDAGVEVELLVIPECPGTEEASDLVRAALDDIGLAETSFVVRVIDTDDQARSHLPFAGSPAFVVDGVDLFESEATGRSLACRIYPTPDGPRNVPGLRDLRKALKEQASRAAEI